MKIYTNTIDLSNPAPKQFWVAPYSNFGIGIKFVNGNNTVEGEISLIDNNGNTLTAEVEKYGDGFTIFYVSSSEKDSDVIYTAIAPNGQKVLITQNVTNSTVFEIGSSDNIESDGTITNIISITQADYDSLAEKDANTLYVITE